MKKRAVFYGRVSSEKEMQLNALDNQMLWYDDLETKLSDEYVFSKKRYIDRGITGTAAKKRPAFMEMIEDSKKDRFDIIITREVARFARNTVESLTYTRQLAAMGIEVYFVNDNIHSMNPEDNLKLQLMSMLAEEESRKDSERAKAGLYIARQNNDSIWGNGNIMGYSRPGGRGTPFIIDREQADTVIMIKDMYLYEKKSLREIRFELERLGRKTATGKLRWNERTVSRILDNPFYTGKQRLCQSEVNNYLEQKRIQKPKEEHLFKDVDVPVLYSFEEYSEIQKIKAERSLILSDIRKGKKESGFFWAKKLICKCGAVYAGRKWRKLRNGEYHIGYGCDNKKKNKGKAVREKLGLNTEGACDMNDIPEWKLELMSKIILEYVWNNKGQDIEDAYNIIRECFKAEKNGCSENELAQINKEISKYMTRIENYTEMRADGDITKDEFRKKLSECQANIDRLTAKKKRIEVQMGNNVDLDGQLKKIKDSLKEMIDFSQNKIDREILDKYIDLVQYQGNYEFNWFLNFGIEDDEVIPEKYQLKIQKKNYFVTDTIIKDSRKLIFETVITYDQALEYRKAHGSYMRPNAWDDIHIRVYT